jgi:hypothetical protein
VRKLLPNPCHRSLQLDDFVSSPLTCTSIRPVDTVIHKITPSVMTLMSRSTWIQRDDCGPILTAVHFYRIPQLEVFVFCPFTRLTQRSIRNGDASSQGIAPSVTTLFFRSTWNQHGNFGPISSRVHLCGSLQLDVFVFSPFTRISSCAPVDARIRQITPSLRALNSCSTWNERGNRNPIYFVLVVPPLLLDFRNGTSQLCIFFWCPATCRCRPSIRLRINHEI